MAEARGARLHRRTEYTVSTARSISWRPMRDRTTIRALSCVDTASPGGDNAFGDEVRHGGRASTGASMSFIPGANVGPYRIVEQAERNGVATTYTAYQPSLGRYVWVVVVPSIERDDLWSLRQYQRQIELALGLRHANILSVLDHGEHLGVPFVVTELVDTEPLAEQLGAPWPLSEVIRILRPLATALDYAHHQG